MTLTFTLEEIQLLFKGLGHMENECDSLSEDETFVRLYNQLELIALSEDYSREAILAEQRRRAEYKASCCD